MPTAWPGHRASEPRGQLQSAGTEVCVHIYRVYQSTYHLIEPRDYHIKMDSEYGNPEDGYLQNGFQSLQLTLSLIPRLRV
jgi:hypothetical protein